MEQVFFTVLVPLIGVGMFMTVFYIPHLEYRHNLYEVVFMGLIVGLLVSKGMTSLQGSSTSMTSFNTKNYHDKVSGWAETCRILALFVPFVFFISEIVFPILAHKKKGEKLIELKDAIIRANPSASIAIEKMSMRLRGKVENDDKFFRYGGDVGDALSRGGDSKDGDDGLSRGDSKDNADETASASVLDIPVDGDEEDGTPGASPRGQSPPGQSPPGQSSSPVKNVTVIGSSPSVVDVPRLSVVGSSPSVKDAFGRSSPLETSPSVKDVTGNLQSPGVGFVPSPGVTPAPGGPVEAIPLIHEEGTHQADGSSPHPSLDGSPRGGYPGWFEEYLAKENALSQEGTHQKADAGGAPGAGTADPSGPATNTDVQTATAIALAPANLKLDFFSLDLNRPERLVTLCFQLLRTITPDETEELIKRHDSLELAKLIDSLKRLVTIGVGRDVGRYYNFEVLKSLSAETLDGSRLKALPDSSKTAPEGDADAGQQPGALGQEPQPYGNANQQPYGIRQKVGATFKWEKTATMPTTPGKNSVPTWQRLNVADMARVWTNFAAYGANKDLDATGNSAYTVQKQSSVSEYGSPVGHHNLQGVGVGPNSPMANGPNSPGGANGAIPDTPHTVSESPIQKQRSASPDKSGTSPDKSEGSNKKNLDQSMPMEKNLKNSNSSTGPANLPVSNRKMSVSNPQTVSENIRNFEKYIKKDGSENGALQAEGNHNAQGDITEDIVLATNAGYPPVPNSALQFFLHACVKSLPARRGCWNDRNLFDKHWDNLRTYLGKLGKMKQEEEEALQLIALEIQQEEEKIKIAAEKERLEKLEKKRAKKRAEEEEEEIASRKGSKNKGTSSLGGHDDADKTSNQNLLIETEDDEESVYDYDPSKEGNDYEDQKTTEETDGFTDGLEVIEEGDEEEWEDEDEEYAEGDGGEGEEEEEEGEEGEWEEGEGEEGEEEEEYEEGEEGWEEGMEFYEEEEEEEN